MSQESHDPELERFARSLSTLVPSTGSLDRDRVFFAAGQFSARRHTNLWRLGTLAALLAGAGIFIADRLRPAPQPVERVVYVQVEVPAKAAPETQSHAISVAMASPAPEQTDAREDSPYSAYRLQETVMRVGFEGLPRSTVLASPGPVLSSEDWRQDRFSELLKP